MRLSDGHFVAEEVVTDTAEVFRYVVWGFTSCRCIAVHHAVGTFTFDGDAERAADLDLAFRPTTALLRPVLTRFVDGDWAAYMAGRRRGHA